MLTVCQDQDSRCDAAAKHSAFLKMLPAIGRAARIAFRQATAELRDELVSDAIARAFVMYTALVKRGQRARVLPTPLARFAIAQVRAGRRVGAGLRIRDVMSSHAQFHKNFILERIDSFSDAEGCWQQLVVEDRRATPADTAACRIDFAAWLARLAPRIRRIALALAGGETTAATAERFGVTPARISQLRASLKENWDGFQGQAVTGHRLRPAAA
jgi:hypothetical protein